MVPVSSQGESTSPITESSERFCGSTPKEDKVVRKMRSCLVVLVILALGLYIMFSCEKESQADVFPHFEPDEWVELQFETEEVLEGLDDRQQRDQMLDWALLAVLGDSTLDAAHLQEVLFDWTPGRTLYGNELASVEYGVTRSRLIGGNQVLALVPADVSDAEKRDLIGEVADRMRVALGEKPSSIQVFEYTLDPGTASGRIRRGTRVGDEQLFGPSYGYHEVSVADVEDLRRFLSQGTSLVGGRTGWLGLEVRGRRRFASPYLGLSVDHVATLWQAEQRVQAGLSKFHETFLDPQDEEAAREFLEMEVALIQGNSHPGVVEGSGFSLDPEFVPDVLLEVFREDLRDIIEFARSEIPTIDAALGADDQNLDRIETALTLGDSTPYLDLLSRLERSSSPPDLLTAAALQLAYQRSFLQIARYDGPLQGTEVGMTLFYTDLLAKLWALNVACGAPADEVPGFQPATQIQVSPVFHEELDELSSTRIWFGPDPSGARPLGEDGLLLAPIATTIFAASSNDRARGDETEPNAVSGAFIGWWNQHFAEVAQYEPRYQQLNEIVKWSELIAWLELRGESWTLGFLANADFETDLWFPDWAAAQEDLRFQQWEEMWFLPRDPSRQHPEALPTLVSIEYDCGWNYGELSGGVSLADAQLFLDRPPTRTDGFRPLRTLRRADLDESSVRTMEGGRRSISALDGRRFHLEPPDRPGVRRHTVFPRDGARFRGEHGEVRPSEFDRYVERGERWLALEDRVQDLTMRRVEVGRTVGGLLRIASRSLDFDKMAQVARSASRHSDPLGTIANDRRVAEAVRDGSESLLVRPEGSPQWFRTSATDRRLDSGSFGTFSDRDGGTKFVSFDPAAQPPRRPPPAGRDIHSEVDGLLKNDRPERALELLDHVSPNRASSSDHHLRRGVSLLRQGRLMEALPLLDGLSRKDVQSIGPLDELISRIRAAAGDDVERSTADALSAFVRSDGKGWSIGRHGNGLEARYVLAGSDRLSRLSWGQIPDLPIGDPRVFLPDTPALHNLDWVSSGQQTLRDLVSDGRIREVYQLDAVGTGLPAAGALQLPAPSAELMGWKGEIAVRQAARLGGKVSLDPCELMERFGLASCHEDRSPVFIVRPAGD
jgi:hypothetical protein